VLATAGAGKTAVLGRRLAWRQARGDLDCRHCLVLTFTRRQAQELIERLQRLGLPFPVAAGTIHARALDELRRRAADLGYRPPRVVADPERLVASAMERARIPSGTDEGDVATSVLAEIAWARAKRLAPEEYAEASERAGRHPPLDPERVALLWGMYAREKRRRGVVDFDDLLEQLADLLEHDSEFRAASRWRFRHLFVDEVQDLTPAQLRLLEAWSGDTEDADLFVVGDFEQSIYGWNGADSELVRRRLLERPGAVAIALQENHRSSPAIVQASEQLRADRRAPEVASAHGEPGQVTLVACSDEATECETVTRIVHRSLSRLEGRCPIAVLGRSRSVLLPVEATLRRQGFSVVSPGGEAAASSPALASVAVGTIHQAKGLEWPCVIVVGMEEGVLPSSLSRGHDALEEERRLCYVAVTRATSELWLTWAAKRPNTVGVAEPSRFLGRLAPFARSISNEALAEPGPARRVQDLRQALDAARRRSGRREPASEHAPVALR